MHFVITALWISSVLYRLVLGQLGALKPPLKPDFWICEHPYFNSGALTTEDCAEAVHQMPKGHERILWHNRNETLDILQFPLIVAHGTCEITVFASGKWAEEKYIRISASPNLFRQLALFVIQDCVVTDQDAGYITHGFQNAIDYVSNPSNSFPTTLDMPANATYFTVVVQASNDMFRMYDRDPGNFDAPVSAKLVQGLERAMLDIPKDSYLREELEIRRRYLADPYLVQDNSLKLQHAWWEPRSRFTLPMMNLTSDERCNSTGQSPRKTNCSVLDSGTPGSVDE